eukprot:3727094-Prymnesium_polylepis.1
MMGPAWGDAWEVLTALTEGRVEEWPEPLGLNTEELSALVGFLKSELWKRLGERDVQAACVEWLFTEAWWNAGLSYPNEDDSVRQGAAIAAEWQRLLDAVNGDEWQPDDLRYYREGVWGRIALPRGHPRSMCLRQRWLLDGGKHMEAWNDVVTAWEEEQDQSRAAVWKLAVPPPRGTIGSEANRLG